MDDLISRAAAIDAAINGADDWDSGYNPERERYIREHIAQLPAVDAVPVVHAYWVEEPDRQRHWRCSNCSVVEGIHSMTMNYCPKCGARMAEHPWLASGVGQAFSPDGDANG